MTICPACTGRVQAGDFDGFCNACSGTQKIDHAVMKGVREYAEGYPVELQSASDDSGRPVVMAYNEARCNSVEIDLIDLLGWLRERKIIE